MECIATWNCIICAQRNHHLIVLGVFSAWPRIMDGSPQHSIFERRESHDCHVYTEHQQSLILALCNVLRCSINVRLERNSLQRSWSMFMVQIYRLSLYQPLTAFFFKPANNYNVFICLWYWVSLKLLTWLCCMAEAN